MQNLRLECQSCGGEAGPAKAGAGLERGEPKEVLRKYLTLHTLHNASNHINSKSSMAT